MENQAQRTAPSRKGTLSDPVKEQGILQEVNRKARNAAREWNQKWGFYKKLREFREEEALKLGLSVEEYRAAIRSLSGSPKLREHPIAKDPSRTPIPQTTYAMIGRRASCPLERYGPLVITGRTIPTQPPRKPGQVYDPYKQTVFFLGSVEGDPISYKLPPAPCEVTDEMWARPQQLHVSPFSYDNLEDALNRSALDVN